MGGFADKVIGGVNKLIRSAIQSPNYVPGISGWTINKDGTAEFDNIEIRGSVKLDPTPDGGDTQPNISWHDAYGYTARMFEGTDGSIITRAGSIDGLPNHAATVQMAAYNPGVFSAGDIELIGGGGGVGSHIGLTADNVIVNTLAGSTSLNKLHVGDTFQVGGGPAGKYYYEEVGLSAQVVASTAAFTAVANLTSTHLISDYGSAFNLASGVWTCPVTGVYHHHFNVGWAAWVLGSRYLLQIVRNAIATANVMNQTDFTTNGSFQGVDVMKYFTAGETVTYRFAQVTGANQTIAAGDERSYISVRRYL
jgi:hypothetical protein